MILVLDTTAIFPDLWLSRTASVTFLRGLPLIPAKLLVPEVVVDEATNHYRRGLEKAMRATSEARKSLSELLAEEVAPGPGINVDQRVTDYREALLKRIKDAGGEVLPYSTIDHKALVERDLAGRKPFRDGGKGYRDALIWENVRSQTWVGDERVVFVSNNTADFGPGPDFHDDLRGEVLNPERLTLIHTIAEVNQGLILPRMQMLEEVRRKLEAHSPAEFSLWTWLTEHLLDLLQHECEDILKLVSDFPEGQGRAWPRELVALKEMHVLSVRKLEPNAMLVRLKAQADVSITLEWHQTGFLHSPGRRGWGRAGGFPDALSSSVLTELRIGLDLMLDRSHGVVLSPEVVMLATPDAYIHDGTWDVPIAPKKDAPESGA